MRYPGKRGRKRGQSPFPDSEEVIPAIEGRYRVRDDRSYYGHSLGALFGAYALFQSPQLFKRRILVSPALYGGFPRLEPIAEQIQNERAHAGAISKALRFSPNVLQAPIFGAEGYWVRILSGRHSQ